jgi:hypothetical protein
MAGPACRCQAMFLALNSGPFLHSQPFEGGFGLTFGKFLAKRSQTVESAAFFLAIFVFF